MALRLLSNGQSINHLIKKRSDEDIINRYSMIVSAADSLIVNIQRDSESRLFIATTKHGQNIAMIPVFGALTKNGDLCSYGMRDYIGMIERANKSDKIAAIVLDMETPGGTVDGTNEFGMAVKGSKKPVVAFGDSMVASAGYWVASQAREIISNKNNPTEFGSIGVLYIHENWEAFIQKEIGSVEIIRAPQSEDKARVNVIEPLTDDQRLDIRAELKALAKEFISTVKKGRGARLNAGEENIFTGKMYPASQAKELGMIDGLDTLQGAINRAGQLAMLTSTSGSSRAQVNTMFKSKLLSSIFGKSEKAAEEKTPTAEEQEATIKAADQKVADLETENQKLKDEKAAQDTKITELEKTVAEQKTQITTLSDEKKTLESKVEEQKQALDKKPTGQATTVITDGNREAEVSSDVKGEKEKSRFRTSIDDEADKYVAAAFPNIK